jgi:malate/lactate dehydrogenase
MTRTGAVVSTLFVYVSPTVQNAANNVYEQKTAADAAYAAANSSVVYRFKTDAERMQYLIGRMGRATTY